MKNKNATNRIIKYKLGFRLHWLEMVLVLVSVFFSGIVISSDMEDRFIYFALGIFSAGILLMKKKVRIVYKF